MGVVGASRNRLLAPGAISDKCAQALGAQNAAQADQQLQGLTLSVSAGSGFQATTNQAGQVTGVKSGQELADDLGTLVTFNGAVNWSDPNKTLATDQDGKQVILSLVSYMALQVGAKSMNTNQFVDLVMLHELSHSLGRDHPVGDAQAFNTNIWTNCF